MDVLKDILFVALDEAKGNIPSADRVAASADAKLFGEGGMDSMGLVQFIVMVEERIDDELGVEVSLASDKAMSRRNSPFLTLGTLAAYIEECLAEESGHAG